MFYSKPYVAAEISNGGYFAAGGRPNDIYPGENTTYTFSNGTFVTVDNVALLKWDFAGANMNGIFVARYGSDGSTTPNRVAFPWDSAGYPEPIITSNDSVISGYYLSGDDLEDVAVLSVLSFEPDSVTEFQAVAQNFLVEAVRDGKKKLVVDLSANNGGLILLAYDLFRQLFPQTEQVGYTRYRENEILLSFANISKKLVPINFDPTKASDTQIRANEVSYNYLYDLNTTDQHFPSFDAKFGPFPYKGSNFTALQSWDLNDPLTTTDSRYGIGIEITGYGTRQNFQQPFATEDIILLYDGFCASTCTLFSDFMRNQGGVKSVAVGGRPSTDPIQGVGGVHGGLLATWENIYQQTQREMGLVNYPDPDYLLIQARRPDVSPMRYSSQAGLNIRDVILPNHVDDSLPAQFVVENADCRLFYTKDMITDVTNTWNAAANAAFNGGKCVTGSLSKRSSKSRRQRRQVPFGPKVERAKTVQVEKETVVKDASWRMRHGQKALE
ncbi:Peptidase S41 family protein [Lachnellula suecica]|uniref:Peptidase S41 family protein n=1 Tax=Lachnellula suecica TaxID=602035 RepID=A0A8T9C7H1_9HELO|nr:Peptidase S41 family protein [Lachnellula suecica]